MVTNNLARSDAERTNEGGRGTGVDVGVIGVAAARTVDPPVPPRSSWAAMEDYAALIDDRTPMRAVPLPLPRGGVDTVASAITGHPTRLSAVLIVGLAASESAAVQRRVADTAGPLVIAEIDVVSAALAAAVMTMLRSRGLNRERASSSDGRRRVGAATRADLIACGIGELTTWRRDDAEDYPLTRLMEHNDILIDPNAAAPMPLAPDRTVTIPHDPFDFGALVLPGLLGALCGHGVAALDIEHLAAATSAVALLTPSDDAARIERAAADDRHRPPSSPALTGPDTDDTQRAQPRRGSFPSLDNRPSQGEPHDNPHRVRARNPTTHSAIIDWVECRRAHHTRRGGVVRRQR